MQTLLAVLATFAFCSCVVVLVVRRALRLVRRRVVRLRDRVQVVARAYGVGPQAELARLRRELGRSVTGAHRALAAAKAVSAPVGDVPGLLARLDLAARSVDGELRMLESHRDPGRIEAQLEQSRARVGLITSAAAQLVDGLLHAAGHDSADLTLLQTACAIEADALRSLDLRDQQPALAAGERQ
ncbi:MAG: hypothetical protein QOE40_3262 [Actinomycetota bacterium]|nr:hypothetical protein [Actinomycetota bacterium]